MKRLGLVLLCVAILVLFLARDDDEKKPDPEAPAPRPPPIRVPGPPPPDAHEQARGIYMLEAEGTRIALDLQAERKFRSHAKFPGREARETTGTWSLGGRNLTLTYLTLGGEPLAGGPKYERARWLGETVELKVPGRDKPVVLRKASVIRHK